MANVLYDSIDPDLLKPALVADLRRGGLFPPAGEKISFADDPLVAQEHSEKGPVVCVVTSTLKKPITYEVRRSLADRDPVVSIVCVYRGKVLSRISAIYANNKIVDLTPYVRGLDGAKPMRNMFYDNVRSQLPIAMDMLYVYGPDKLSSIMETPGIPLKYENVLQSLLGNFDVRRAAVLDMLAIVKPTPQDLIHFLDVCVEHDSNNRGMSVGSSIVFNIRSVTTDKNTVRAAFDFVLKNKRWPINIDEVAHGAPMQVYIPQFGLTLKAGEPAIFGDRTVHVSAEQATEGLASLKISTGKGGQDIYLRMKVGNVTDNRVEGYVENEPSCLRTLDDLVDYAKRTRYMTDNRVSLTKILADTTPGLCYTDLTRMMEIIEKAPELAPESAHRVKFLYDTQSGILRVSMFSDMGSVKTASIPIGIPPRDLVSFLMTHGLSSDARAAKSVLRHMNDRER